MNQKIPTDQIAAEAEIDIANHIRVHCNLSIPREHRNAILDRIKSAIDQATRKAYDKGYVNGLYDLDGIHLAKSPSRATHASERTYSDHCPRCGGSRQTLPCPVCEPAHASEQKDWCSPQQRCGKATCPICEAIKSNAAHESEPLKVSEIAICGNCGTQQHDQIDKICATCNRDELVNLVDILKQGRDWLKSRPAHASETPAQKANRLFREDEEQKQRDYVRARKI